MITQYHYPTRFIALDTPSSALNYSFMPDRVASPTPSGLLDIAGSVASIACAAHCIALPVLLVAFPALPLRALREPWAEWTFVLLSLIFGVVSFGPTAASREGRTPLALFLAGGATLLAVRTLVPEHAQRMERIGLVIGAVMLVSAHLVNRARMRHRCTCAMCERNDSVTDSMF
jgi:hypothetical protein